MQCNQREGRSNERRRDSRYIKGTTKTDSESRQRLVGGLDSGMETATDSFGSPLGAEWGPAMVA